MLAYLAHSGITWGARTSIKPSIDRIELSSTIAFKLRLRANASMPERSPIGIKLDDIERIVDDMFEKDRMSDPRLMHSITRVIRIFTNSLFDSLSEAILYESLRESFRSRLGLNNLRFIPFDRSVFVLGLESASREPFTRSEFLHRFVREFYSSAIVSYVYWASKGRSRLLEDKLSEKQATLLKASTPLLEGKLSTDVARRLLYMDWCGSTVDFQLSSALVEEVSGLVFTLLSVDDNAIMLIEEPGAQLHPGAQIVMALFLASLPNLCGCRVVATTHSDLLAITLSQLVVQKPGREWIKELLEKLLPHVKGDIDTLAEATAEAVRNLDLRVYEFTRKGRVKPVKPEDVLGREVPRISRVIDELTDRAFRLASYRASRETG
ncbi:MAG: ATP-binding protein [Caldisphaeraceae archaeon]|nr:ATP-binding protein [Caldisphaeraceae archaeon]